MTRILHLSDTHVSVNGALPIDPGSRRRLRAERGIPHLDATGNHDARGPLREALGSGHLGATVVDLADPASPTFHVFAARDPRAGEQVYL